MECKRCGGANRGGARFCVTCGEVLTPRCASCDAELPSGARFCDSCGTPVGDASAERESTATRKTVTVLFSDLTGSTGLGERMDPESVRSLMAPIYAAMRYEVESRGGHVSKFVGDGVMAVFGIPDVHEDDALRALDAALGMQRALDRLAADIAREHGAVLALKVGINTGEIVVGAGDEDIVGDCVNVASRLEGAAAPGEVLAGEGTWRLTRSMATYEVVAPLALRGKAEPVPAHRLVSLERTTEAGSTTFVGRDPELERLKDAFDEAVDAQASRLVTIVGSPGLGKTRLARELGVALDQRALVIETRCDAAGSSTFDPVADALRSAAGIDVSDDPDKVTSKIAALVDDEPDRDRIAARAAALLGAGAPGSTEETFWAIRRIVERAARVRPIVLILDDLHWAEPLLLDLVEHLAEWNKTSPVLLVVTGRPELRDIRPALVEGGRATTVVSLEGLDDGSTEQLACGLLGTERVPTELLARLPSSTDGNPLFVRELVRMLVDDGVLRRTDGAWVSTINIEAIEVPPTIHSLLAARVDGLSAQERTVLELASVIGKEFYKGALSALAPASVQVSMDAHLESLRRKELVEPVGTYWIDEPVFRFHHALIQDAAYRRLLKDSRADLHERVAQWLEAKTGEVIGEHDELIGYHLEQAHESRRQLGPLDDAGRELGARAATLLASAARSALDRDDLPASAALAGRALDRLERDHPERAEILIVRCEALLATGDVGAAAGAVDEFSSLASSPRSKAWAGCFAGELAILTDPSHLPEIEQSLSAAAAELAALGDPAGAAKAHTVHGRTLGRLGRVAESELAFDKAKVAAQQAGDNRRITDVLDSALTAALWGPSPVSRAGGRCLDLVRLLRITTGSRAVEQTSLRCQAVLESFRGRARAARKMLADARGVLEELGLRQGLLETAMFAGIVELVDGEPAAAEPHLREAYEGLIEMGVDVDAARAAALLARAHLQMGAEQEADRYSSESLRLAGHDLKAAIAWRAVRAEILSRQGRDDEARRLAQAAVDLASKTDALVDHGDACLALSEVCRAAGDASAARTAAEQAASLYERKGATALLVKVHSRPQVGQQLTAQSAGIPDLQSQTNAQIAREFQEAFSRHDWNTIADRVAPDIVFDDRRRGMQDNRVGRDAVLELIAAAAALPGMTYDWDVVAVRGERLTLARQTFRSSTGTDAELVVEVLVVLEATSENLLVTMIYFDRDDFDAAITELDERYMAGEGAPFAESLRAGLLLFRAANSGDTTTFRSLLADDFVLVDHRPAALGELRGADRFVESWKELFDLAPGARRYAARVDAIDERNNLVLIVIRTASDDEITYWSLSTMQDGVFTRQERFSLEQRDLALERFAALSTGADWAIPPNRCTRSLDKFVAAFVDRDWESIAALHAPTAIWSDKRTGFSSDVGGLEAIVENCRVIAEVGVTRIDRSLIATRGETLALWREISVGTGQGTWEAELLTLCEVDGDGLITARSGFDPDALDAAIDELDDRFRAGEGAEHADLIAVVAVTMRARNSRDWASVRARLSDDIVIVDHRPASLGEIRGADAAVGALEELYRVISELHVYCAAMPIIEADLVLGLVSYAGSSDTGAEVEIGYWGITQIRDGKATRQERFPVDRYDLALERFRELGKSESSGSLAPNRCAQLLGKLEAAFNERDWEAFAAVHARHVVYVDKRSGLHTEIAGREAIVENMKAIAEFGVGRLDRALIALRGETLAVWRERYRGVGQGAWEAELIGLFELDAAGELAAGVAYDPNDLESALKDLDERFVAGEGAPYRQLLEVFNRGTAAYNARDWEAYRAALADDLVLVDHRPASLPEIRGREAWVQSAKALIEVMPEARSDVIAYHAIDSERFLAQVLTCDNDHEIEFLMIGLRAGNRLARLEFFATDQLSAALGRLEELAKSERPKERENACSRAGAALADAFADRDWIRFGSLLAEDAAFVDHRTLVAQSATGRGNVVEVAKSVASIGTQRVAATLLAVRGARLSLSRIDLLGRDLGSGAFVSTMLQLLELDVTGRISTWMAFEPDDLDRAFGELDERYIADEGAPHADISRSAIRVTSAINTQDWDAWSAGVADDFVLEDHRPAALGKMTKDEVLAANKTLREVIPNLRIHVTQIHALAPDLSLAELAYEGRSEDGDPYDMSFLALSSYRDGLVSRAEFFPLDQLDSARARFEELQRATPFETGRLANAATTALDRLREVFAARDWGAVGALFAIDCLGDDRRSGVSAAVTGREGVLENMRAVASVGATTFENIPVAVRGQNLTLSRHIFVAPSDGADFAVEILQVVEVDPEGLVTSFVIFDAHDVDAAYDELYERFVSGAGRHYPEMLELERRTLRAVNARDWETYRACFVDDLVQIDHRPASLGEIHGADEHLRAIRELVDVIPTLRWDIPVIHELESTRALAHLQLEGRTADGDEIDVSFHGLYELDGGRVARFEIFRIEDLAAALARFEELTRAQSDHSGNGCTHTSKRWTEAFARRDWDEVADCIAEDWRFEDRRAGLQNVLSGRSAGVDNLKAIADLGGAKFTLETVASRGERLALARRRIHGESAGPEWSVEYLTLEEVDVEGRVTATVTFDHGDYDGAFAELDERFATGEGTGSATLVRLVSRVVRATNSRDWVGLRSTLAEDAVFEDHRPASLGRITPDEWVESLRVMTELVPDLMGCFVSYRVLEGDRCVVETRLSGASENGVEIELKLENVVYADGDLLTGIELFGADQFDEAFARFEELAGS